jgi:hypothetical protein
MIFEYRKYTATPGKLSDVHKRFEDSTLGLFKKYGMETVAFWTPVSGGDFLSELHYILKWEDVPTMQEAWANLVADPEWSQAVAESEKNGPTLAAAESRLWALTPYSPVP